MPKFVYASLELAQAAARSLRAPPVKRVYGRRVRDRARLAPDVELVARPVLEDDGRFALVVPDRHAGDLRDRGDADEERP